jgi:hypothetical protein
VAAAAWKMPSGWWARFVSPQNQCSLPPNSAVTTLSEPSTPLSFQSSLFAELLDSGEEAGARESSEPSRKDRAFHRDAERAIRRRRQAYAAVTEAVGFHPIAVASAT